jgi:hypothetical protein
VGAGEQLDQAEAGELLVRRGAGRCGAAVLRQQEVALAAPASGIERGLAEAALPSPTGVVDDRGAVLVEVAGELADRWAAPRFSDRNSVANSRRFLAI